MDPLLGKTLGNFLVQEPLGRGGMARVYKGLDLSLKRPVAIKVISENLRTSASYAHRFEGEAQAVANLKHPNIVTVFHFGSQDGLYYLVMEYIEGADLDSIIRNYERADELMPHNDVIRILETMASALDYAHLHGVIHRDIKPSNVMLERNGRPVLTDFGLALRVSEGTVGDSFGSPHYIAPEQAQNSANAVPQSDIYSLGIMAYEMLTGVVPFDDPSPTALAMQHILAEVPSPRALNRDLSEGVERVLLKALAKQPEDRYQTAREFIEMLSRELEAMKQNPVKVTTADLPPLPPGMVLPPPRRMSMQTAHDKLAQELAIATAKGQALTRRQSTIGQANAPRQRRQGTGILSYIIAGVAALVVLGVVAFFLSNLLKTAPNEAAEPTPTAQSTLVAVVPTAQAPTRMPTNAPPTVVAAVIATTVVPTTVPTTAIPATLTPTNTPTTVAPTTVAPTNTVATTPTEVPATVAPSATTQPSTAMPIPPTSEAAAAQPTVLYPGGRKLVLVYNQDQILVSNQIGDKLLIAPLAFERLLTDGSIGERFEAKRWAAYYPYLEVNRCNYLKAAIDFKLSREDCPWGANSTINALSNERFWTPKDGSVEFRVLWNKDEIARCKIAEARCELRLPPA